MIADALVWRGTGTVNGGSPIVYAALERGGVRLVAVAMPKDGIFERGASLFDMVLHGLVAPKVATFDLKKLPETQFDALQKGDTDRLAQVFAKDARFVLVDQGKVVGPTDITLGAILSGKTSRTSPRRSPPTAAPRGFRTRPRSAGASTRKAPT